MTTIRPFRIDIPETQLIDLRDRLTKTRWPDELDDAGWSYGVNRRYLIDLVEYWRESYDWRRTESRLNAFAQYVTEIDGQQVHFLHVRSAEPNATPLLLTHGWPSTVHDFADIIGPLTDPRAHGGDPADAFHVVAPSVPGFAFSGPTRERGWGVKRVAGAWLTLMSRLGYDRFGLQGGDVGSLVSPEVGRQAPERVIGVHVNALVNASTTRDPAELDKLTAAERERCQEQARTWQRRSGYATEMSTRPQTIAYALNDSPTGQLAWNLEWFVDWDPELSDQNPIAWDDILANVTIFWVTRTAGSAARFYLEMMPDAWGAQPPASTVPTAVAVFPGDGALRTLAGLHNRVVRWNRFTDGGHFASLQAPQRLVEDVRSFFRDVRAGRFDDLEQPIGHHDADERRAS